MSNNCTRDYRNIPEYCGVYLMKDGSIKQSMWFYGKRIIYNMVVGEPWFGAVKLLYIVKKK